MTIEEMLAEQEVWQARFDRSQRMFTAARTPEGMARWSGVQDECLINLRHYARLIRERVEGES
jgi:hypothetical protein